MEVICYAYAAAVGAGVKNIVGVYNYMRVVDVAPPVKSDIEATWQTNIGTPLLLCLHSSFTQTYNTVRFFDDALDPPQAFTETGVGAVSGDRAPDYVAACVQLGTGLRGRSYRGSKHFGPIAESDTTGDVIATGSITKFQNLAMAVVAGFTDGAGNLWFPVIKSNKPPAQYEHNPTTVVANIVSSYKLNKTLGTMRRRKQRTIVV